MNSKSKNKKNIIDKLFDNISKKLAAGDDKNSLNLKKIHNEKAP